MIRIAACAALLLTGCGLPRKPEPTPPPLVVVCAPEAIQRCQPVRYAIPEGPITADQAASIAIAERAAWCECAHRHAILARCVMRHNGSEHDGEDRGPCEDRRD